MDLSGHLADLVLRDRQARRRRVRLRLLITGALAASILVMALAGQFLPPLHRRAASSGDHVAKDSNHDNVRVEQAAGFGIGQSVVEARQAVVSLSEQWAERAKNQAKALLPVDVDVDAVPNMAASLEPAAQSLQKVGQGALDSLEPLAMSARRALNYFVSELPVFDDQR
jgi:hypothetical protein